MAKHFVRSNEPLSIYLWLLMAFLPAMGLLGFHVLSVPENSTGYGVFMLLLIKATECIRNYDLVDKGES